MLALKAGKTDKQERMRYLSLALKQLISFSMLSAC